MSAYQALYRKYRPQTFDDVVGQLAVTQTLKTQLQSGRLSHVSGVERTVLRNEIPRTRSGGEPSSLKWIFSCAARLPFLSWLHGDRA